MLITLALTPSGYDAAGAELIRASAAAFLGPLGIEVYVDAEEDNTIYATCRNEAQIKAANQLGWLWAERLSPSKYNVKRRQHDR